jgi:hypothetical protein
MGRLGANSLGRQRFLGPILAGFLLFSARTATAASDPCDFASSVASTFSYQQVKRCYESVPFDRGSLHNIVSVVKQHRAFSDLGELYEARSPWKEGLAALERRAYPGDFAMNEALKKEHLNLQSAHIGYITPKCYWLMLNAFMPFDFGVTQRFTQRKERELVFIEGAPILPELYQQATGIDVQKLVGMKVVTVNGVPALDYFRRFGREQLKPYEDDGARLNAILNEAAYSFRLGAVYDSIPERSSDEYVLESRSGKRVRVVMPWLFVRTSVLSPEALPVSSSSADFAAACMAAAPPPEIEGAGVERLAPNWFGELAPERHKRRLLRAQQRPGHSDNRGFFEVPPEELGKNIQEVIPLTHSAQVLDYGQDTTVLRLFDTVEWIDVARAGIEHACQHSQRLIIDLRRNGGGNDSVIHWLHRHLFPAQTDLVQAGLLPLRLRNDNEALNELFFNTAAFDALAAPLGVPPCVLGLGPGCLLDMDSGAFMPVAELEWFRSPSVTEKRGRAWLTLTRQISLPMASLPESDAASCAGRFAGNNLVFLTDGLNASGGYFLPAAFKGLGPIVTMGGYSDEPMAMGRARGGATFPGSFWANSAALLGLYSEGELTFEHQYAAFERDVETQMELLGAYRKDRKTLHLEQPVRGDLFLDVWSDSPGTEGYVYRRLLALVDQPRQGSRPERF